VSCSAAAPLGYSTRGWTQVGKFHFTNFLCIFGLSEFSSIWGRLFWTNRVQWIVFDPLQTSYNDKIQAFFLVGSIRTPILINGIIERTEINPMHFKWEMNWTHGNQPNTFEMGQRVNSHFVFIYHFRRVFRHKSIEIEREGLIPEKSMNLVCENCG